MTLGLGNIQALLSRLGHPEKAFNSIVIAGTNGKGSVAAYLSSVLKANGVSVGRYTSPHIYSVTERIWVQGELISLDRMESLASRIVPLYSEVPFSYFEAITAIAFLEFARRGVDFAVLEVGLGGRFDATNVVDPVLTILTNISMDHRRILGDSEEEILREKLGITRPGVPLLVGELSRGLYAHLERKQKREGFSLRTLGNIGSALVEKLSLDGMFVRLRTQRTDYGIIRLPFPGNQQAENALLAVGAAEYLLDEVKNVPEAIGTTYLPGRFETIKRSDKTVILDVAHNDASLSASAKTFSLVTSPETSAIVFGLMRRKEILFSVQRILSAARRLYLVTPEGGDAYTPQALLSKIDGGTADTSGIDIVAWNCGDVSRGWDRLFNTVLHPSNPFSCILVTGSHHTVESFGKRLNGKELA
jgi:dihydrofolate synthase/folylpolyglutamate synthase